MGEPREPTEQQAREVLRSLGFEFEWSGEQLAGLDVRVDRRDRPVREAAPHGE